MAFSLHEHAAAVQDIDEAIHRLPQDVVDARMQRLKRAVDCSLKKSYLSKEIQDMQTPYSWYLKVMHLVLPHPPHPAFKLVHVQSKHAMRLGFWSCAENEAQVLHHPCGKATASYNLSCAYSVIKLAIRL